MGPRRAVRHGDHYRVSGQKVFISRTEHSDLMLLLARTTPREQAAKTTDGLSVFIVDLREAVAKLAEAGIAASVTGREEHIYSIYRKMREKHAGFAQVSDIFGFRIVVGTLPECYLALGVLHQLYKPVPGRFKDYIALPKPNMYQSLHTTVMGPGGQRMEVQIRTEEMHRIAEEGIAAHWKYKEGGTGARGDESRFGWLRQMMEWQRELKDSREFMSSVKIDLFPEEVYVFTPEGDVKELPRDSTPVVTSTLAA